MIERQHNSWSTAFGQQGAFGLSALMIRRFTGLFRISEVKATARTFTITIFTLKWIQTGGVRWDGKLWHDVDRSAQNENVYSERDKKCAACEDLGS